MADLAVSFTVCSTLFHKLSFVEVWVRVRISQTLLSQHSNFGTAGVGLG
jgi:hypothetical protein